jgi:hypothetical protein
MGQNGCNGMLSSHRYYTFTLRIQATLQGPRTHRQALRDHVETGRTLRQKVANQRRHAFRQLILIEIVEALNLFLHQTPQFRISIRNRADQTICGKCNGIFGRIETRHDAQQIPINVDGFLGWHSDRDAFRLPLGATERTHNPDAKAEGPLDLLAQAGIMAWRLLVYETGAVGPDFQSDRAGRQV